MRLLSPHSPPQFFLDPEVQMFGYPFDDEKAEKARPRGVLADVTCEENAAKMATSLLKLKCAVQNYAWGKKGTDSEVAKLYASGDADAEVSEEKPYAELWMGTHPSGPSVVSSTGATLKEWIAQNDACLGSVLKGKYGTDLPFLFNHEPSRGGADAYSTSVRAILVNRKSAHAPHTARLCPVLAGPAVP